MGLRMPIDAVADEGRERLGHFIAFAFDVLDDLAVLKTR